MNPLKKYLWAAVAVLIVLWHIAFGAFWNRHGRLALQHDYDKAKIEANADARKLEALRQSRVDEAARVAVGRNSALRLDAERSRVAASGLRDTLDALRLHSAQSSDAAAKSIAALSDVFQQCNRAYAELAEIADRHASDSLTYQQSWPKE